MVTAELAGAFVAQPQIPPRNVNWSSSGKWMHGAKIRRGTGETSTRSWHSRFRASTS